MLTTNGGMKIVGIVAEVSKGTSFESAARMAVHLAMENMTTVRYRYNGEEYEVNCGDIAAQVKPTKGMG